jgi:hypothetical protein
LTIEHLASVGTFAAGCPIGAIDNLIVVKAASNQPVGGGPECLGQIDGALRTAGRQGREMRDAKATLSTLWVFVLFNYLYCDVLGLMDKAMLRGYLEGEVGGIHVTGGFLLASAILMEIPIAMVGSASCRTGRSVGEHRGRRVHDDGAVLDTVLRNEPDRLLHFRQRRRDRGNSGDRLVRVELAASHQRAAGA